MIGIKKPSVNIWTVSGNSKEEFDAHVARCARVCYANESNTNNDKLVERLVKSKHFSMFRHITHYFCIHESEVAKNNLGILDTILKYPGLCPYMRVFKEVSESKLNKWYWVAANGQFVAEHPEIFTALLKYNASPNDVLQYCPNLMRYTVKVRTQISTTRELNRVSPNNISEESTRYCNYSLDKFNGMISLCQPHWFELWENSIGLELYKEDEVIRFQRCTTFGEEADDNTCFMVKDKTISFDCMGVKINKYSYDFLYRYLTKFDINAEDYIAEVKDFGIDPQDARGELHLDTCTNAVYTYFLDEWKHIIDLRYKGTTGKPHPNAKLIVGKINEAFNKRGIQY